MPSTASSSFSSSPSVMSSPVRRGVRVLCDGGASPLTSCPSPITSSSSSTAISLFSSFLSSISRHVLGVLLPLPVSPSVNAISSSSSPSSSSFIDSSFSFSSFLPSLASEFNYTIKQSVVPLIASRISLPDSIHSVPLLSVLPPHLSSLYCDPHRLLLPTLSRERALRSKRRPFGKPRVNGSRCEYIATIRRMMGVGMLDFTITPKAVNSVFTVSKDADSDRLIIDAQLANSYFIPCPKVKLPNPSHLASLCVPAGMKLVVCKSDLSNFYHHIHIPSWLRRYLCLPSVTAGELGLSAYPSGQLVYPMCTTLPMGWSHSVFVAQSIHEHILYANNIIQPCHNIINITSPVLQQGQPLHSIYVDDLSLFDVVPHDTACVCSSSTICTQFASILSSYAAANFPPKQSKTVAPTVDGTVVLGMLMCRTNVCVDHAKIRDTILTTVAMLNVGAVSGAFLSRVIGSWTWMLLLRRPTLSILRSVYRFIACAGDKTFDIWPSVRCELAMLIAVAPLLSVNLCSPFASTMLASDASTIAGGVVSSPCHPLLTRRMWPMYYRQHQHLNAESERWSFPHFKCESSTASPLFVSPTLAIRPSSAASLLQPALSLLPPLNNFVSMRSLVSSAQWSTLISHRWCYPSCHINHLETHAFILSLRWYLSTSASMSSRFYSLVDSSALYYGLRKGRSSSSLFGLFRYVAALLLSSGCCVLPVWVPSEWNPADKPSRLLP